MRYSRVLQSVLCLYGLAVLLNYASFGDNRYVDPITILLTILVSLVFILVLATMPDRSAELEMTFVTISMLFLCPPIFLLLVRPASAAFGGTYRHDIIMTGDVNRAIAYTCIGTVLFVAGLRAAGLIRAPVPRRNRTPPGRPASVRLIGVAILTLAFELILGVYYGRFTTDMGEAGGAVGILALVARFINTDSSLIVVVVTAAHLWKILTRRTRFGFIFVIGMMVTYRTVSGSRQILLFILILFLAALSDRFGDFVVSRRVLGFIAIAALGSILTFPVATAVRDYWLFSSRQGHLLSWSDFRQIRDHPDGGGEPNNPLLVLAVRLNGLDPIVAVSSGHPVDRDKYVGVGIVAKSFINMMVPGTPFPEAREMSKTFLVVYLGYPITYLDYYYVTCMWMLWGDALALFGSVGGLVWLFIFGATISLAFSWLTRRRNPDAAFWRVVFIYLMYVVTVDFGLDTVGATAVYMALPLFVVMKLSGIYRKRPRFVENIDRPPPRHSGLPPEQSGPSPLSAVQAP